MKLFLKKTFYFLSIPLCLLCISFIYFDLFSNFALNHIINDNDIQYLIAGDSHIRQTFNDKNIYHCKNIAQNSESYYFTYFKLKKILTNKNDIKIVFLGLSYHNFSGYIDDFIFGKYSGAISKNYFFILPIKEQIHLFFNNANESINFFKGIFSMSIKNCFSHEKSFIGAYNNVFFNSKSNIKSIDKRIKSQYFTKDNKIYKTSEFNIKYLYKIIEFCKSKNVKLIFLNPPLEESYFEKIPTFYQKYYNSFVDKNNIQVLEFQNIKLDSTCFIPDGDHVSAKGAQICTNALNDYISKR